MDIKSLREIGITFVENDPGNFLASEDVLREDLIGMRIFQEPIFAVGSPQDPLFENLKDPHVVHEDFMMPEEWLKDPRSILSFFLPYTSEVKSANGRDMSRVSDEWLHGRIEGQLFLEALGRHLTDHLRSRGYEAVFPTTDSRFRRVAPFASNWSERHVAYICGLGTFSLSKGLITEKGIAGRFGSILTTAELPVTKRPYEGLFDYCIMCGKCALHCPVQAIDPSKGVAEGKDHPACSDFVDSTFQPPKGAHRRIRYGCGKCQVKVPCESRIPGR